jgi:DNA-binding MarR family transcriptional regulator
MGMTPEQQVVSGTVKTIFRLNGQFLSIAETLAAPAGMTAAWWQVLGTVLDAPRSVADIARAVGVTRQSVQRVADLLVDRGLAEYRPNPAHRRAKLLRATHEGHAAVHRIAPGHAAFAAKLVEIIGHDKLGQVHDALTQLADTLEVLDWGAGA